MLTDWSNRPVAMLRRKAGTWWRLPQPEKGFYLLAYPLLGLARLVLLTIPFRWIAPWLGTDGKTAAVLPLASGKEMAVARAIGRSIRIAARHTPWESKCLAQAMVARALLGLQGVPYVLFLGVKKDGVAGMAAHAWVATGRIAVTGGRGFGVFTVVGTFLSDTLSPETRASRGDEMLQAPGRGAAPRK